MPIAPCVLWARQPDTVTWSQQGWPGSFAHSNVVSEAVKAIFLLYLALLHDNIFIFCPPLKEVLLQMLPPTFDGTSMTPSLGVHPPVLLPFRLPCPALAGSAALACLRPGPHLLLCVLSVALPSSLTATLLSPSVSLSGVLSFLQPPGWGGYQTFSSPSPFSKSHFFPESPLRASTFAQGCPVTRTWCTGLSQLPYTVRMLFR